MVAKNVLVLQGTLQKIAPKPSIRIETLEIVVLIPEMEAMVAKNHC